jgi:hypothetical protein
MVVGRLRRRETSSGAHANGSTHVRHGRHVTDLRIFVTFPALQASWPPLLHTARAARRLQASQAPSASRAGRSVGRDGRGDMVDSLDHRRGQARQWFCPKGDCTEARITLPNCEFCCVRGAAIGQ